MYSIIQQTTGIDALVEGDRYNKETIEIVIREDQAPKRDVVEEYKRGTNHIVNYVENEENCGYDKNIRQDCVWK